MYDAKSSIIIILSIVGIIITITKLAGMTCKFIYTNAENTSLSYVRRIESDRGEFALLIQSLQHQIELMSKRVDELEHRREELEKENYKCLEKIKDLQRQLESKG